MTRLMLINGQHAAEELRVALVDDGKLEEYQVEVAEAGQCRGNIYRGVVANVERSLNAAFVDVGMKKHGFLALADVVPEAYQKEPSNGRPKIDEVLEQGASVLVQITRDPEGTKGATLTTSLSLAGRYVVLTPFDASHGLSRKVTDEAERKKIKDRTKDIPMPEGCGLIIRTNAADQTKTALRRDINALVRLYKRVLAEGEKGRGFRLLYSDQDIVVRALRDYLDVSIEEVVIDNDELMERAQQYVQAVMPRSKVELTRYQQHIPLLSHYGLESQIDAIFQRTVALPSGGSIVIDTTEALVAIDVNSGRSTSEATKAETVLSTNLEAAEAVAAQLRLRDLGGLFVIDFIDMRSKKDQRRLESALKTAMKSDRARFSIGHLSSNGLLEVNRQRIHQAIAQRTHRGCPTCGGVGRVASTEWAGLSLLRRIHGQAATGRLDGVRATLHPDLAHELLNRRRGQLARLEQQYGIEIEIHADRTVSPSQEQVEWRTRQSADGWAPAPSVAEEQPRPRKQGRSRGGRSQQDKRQQQAGKRSNGVQASAVVETVTEPESSAEQTKEPSGRRRRRRRRGKRSNGSGNQPAEAASESSGGEVDAEQVNAEPVKAEPVKAEPEPVKAELAKPDDGEERSEDAKVDAPAKRSKKRRGRRRGSRKSAAPAEAQEPAASSEEPPAQKRSRRGRRKRPAKAAENAEQTEGPPEVE